MTTHDTRETLAVTLGELEGWLSRAGTGEMVAVPDGLVATIDRLRSDLTSTLGPRDAGDLAWMLGEILKRLERLESMTLAGRWRALCCWGARCWGAFRAAVACGVAAVRPTKRR